jgi:hydrogenase 3 maturation protease
VRETGKGDFELHLRERLAGARRVAVVGIGDSLLPRDRLGLLAAEGVADLHLPGVKVFLAGTVPESMTGPIRRCRPDHVLFLDAAEMGVRPGTVAIVEPERIQATLFSTHVLPLSVLMEFLEKDAHTRVTLIGIEPDTESRGDEPTPPERVGLQDLVAVLDRILGGDRENLPRGP